MRWEDLEGQPAPHFGWREVRAAHEAMDASMARASIAMAMEDVGVAARACPGCGAAATDLTWVSIGASDAAWAAGDHRCGWLTICAACGVQVDFHLDEEMVALRREGAW